MTNPLELYKVTIASVYGGQIKKKFYESTRTFEQHWKYHKDHNAKWYHVIAYQIDWKNKCWKKIREKSPSIG